MGDRPTLILTTRLGVRPLGVRGDALHNVAGQLLAVIRRLEADPEPPMADTVAADRPYESAAELLAELNRLARETSFSDDARDLRTCWPNRSCVRAATASTGTPPVQARSAASPISAKASAPPPWRRSRRG